MENCSTLLIVDVQKGFANDAAKHVVPLISELQHQYKHVIVTRFINVKDSYFQRIRDWHRFEPESLESELAFQPRQDARLIDKPGLYTCVTREFITMLRGFPTEEVHIVGIDTDICVTTCAVDLMEYGIRPVILAKYCASHGGAQYHDWGIEILKRLLGKEQVQE